VREGKRDGMFSGESLVGALAALTKHGSSDARLTFELVMEEL
tara:strand:+ start:65 stop:190 length:126 start_codon:yes stop_codon:yes gene_type:complete